MEYALISHKSEVDGISFTEYGMAIYKCGILFRMIEALSTNRKATQGLIDLLNKEKPEPVHIDDIVEDFCLEYT